MKYNVIVVAAVCSSLEDMPSDNGIELKPESNPMNDVEKVFDDDTDSLAPLDNLESEPTKITFVTTKEIVLVEVIVVGSPNFVYEVEIIDVTGTKEKPSTVSSDSIFHC